MFEASVSACSCRCADVEAVRVPICYGLLGSDGQDMIAKSAFCFGDFLLK